MSRKLHALLKLHRYVGSLVCEEMGHVWRDVRTDMDGAWTTPRLQRCETCRETRSHPNDMGSSSSGGIFEVTE